MSLKEKAIVLLSGGLDSTVSLAEGLEQYDILLALTFNYGQRAFGKELRASKRIAEHYRIQHQIISLPWLSNLLPQALMIQQAGLGPDIPESWVPGHENEESFLDAKTVWVPNRNGLFLNIAATFAESYQAQVILFGANAEEGERFPDNTDAFRQSMNAVFAFSTLNHPRVECPVGHLNKPQIVERALSLNVPLELIWSCYNDRQNQCGACPSCYRLKHALEVSEAPKKLKKTLAFIYN